MPVSIPNSFVTRRRARLIEFGGIRRGRKITTDATRSLGPFNCRSWNARNQPIAEQRNPTGKAIVAESKNDALISPLAKAWRIHANVSGARLMFGSCSGVSTLARRTRAGNHSKPRINPEGKNVKKRTKHCLMVAAFSTKRLRLRLGQRRKTIESK